jgi:hypothetical protein
MSRGLGRLQREILEALNADVPTVLQLGMAAEKLAAQCYYGSPRLTSLLKRGEIYATRRALEVAPRRFGGAAQPG